MRKKGKNGIQSKKIVARRTSSKHMGTPSVISSNTRCRVKAVGIRSTNALSSCEGSRVGNKITRVNEMLSIRSKRIKVRIDHSGELVNPHRDAAGLRDLFESISPDIRFR